MSNFAFLRSEWPDLHESALKVEAFATPDPRTSCFYARLTLGLAVHWLYKHDATLKLPYQENLSALIHEPTFKQLVGNAVFANPSPRPSPRPTGRGEKEPCFKQRILNSIVMPHPSPSSPVPPKYF